MTSSGSAVPGWFRGDLHVHSRWPDGGLTPAELAVAARAAGLDFLVSTEHNRTAPMAEWTADAPDLLVIAGQEVVTSAGHWLALGLPEAMLIDWHHDRSSGGLPAEIERVHDVGGVTVVAHPHAPQPANRFAPSWDGFHLVEVWNGPWRSDNPWQADNDAALADWVAALAREVPTGRWRPAVGNSDTHLAGQLGTPHTVVRCEQLTAPAVLAAARAGRSWLSANATIGLEFTARVDPHSHGIVDPQGHGMSVTCRTNDRHGAGGQQGWAQIGDVLDADGAPVTVQVRVDGPRAGTLSVHDDHGVVGQTALARDGVTDLRCCVTEALFVRVEVRGPEDSMLALSNPIVLR